MARTGGEPGGPAARFIDEVSYEEDRLPERVPVLFWRMTDSMEMKS